jgi:MFS family permease
LLIVERPEDIGLEPDGHPNNDAIAPEGIAAKSQAVQSHGEIDRTLREAMGTKALWVLTGVVGALFLIQAGVSVHIGAFFQDRGLSLTLVATAITINGIVNAIGSLVWGATIERVPVRWAMGILMLITAGSTIALLAVHSVTTAFIVSAVIGIVGSGGNVIPPVAYASYFGRRSIGNIRGVGETGVQVGQTIGPVLSGLAFDINGSYQVAFLIFAVLALIGAGLISFSKPPKAF